MSRKQAPPRKRKCDGREQCPQCGADKETCWTRPSRRSNEYLTYTCAGFYLTNDVVGRAAVGQHKCLAGTPETYEKEKQRQRNKCAKEWLHCEGVRLTSDYNSLPIHLFGVIDQQIAGVPRVRRTLIFSENSSDLGIEKRFPCGRRGELTTPR